MDEKTLERFYQERLEEKIIEYLAEKHSIDYQSAMDIYYSSKMADKIHEGKYGIQYLDHKVLGDILDKNEPYLFKEG